MPKLIVNPTVIEAAGNKPKIIREYVGRVNSKDDALSIAHMISPPGWIEPGQRPEFDEYTVVLDGCLEVHTETGETVRVSKGQAVVARRGEWVRYATPDGAEYLAVCLPAFGPDTVHRDEDERYKTRYETGRR